MAVIPVPARAGVLGMARTTAASSVMCLSRVEVVTPAATEMTRVPEPSSPETSSRRLTMSWGLIASTTVSARFAASLVETTSTP